MSLSLASAGSPAVPRVAATWVRATAAPALGVALADVAAARDRATLGFVGASGGAYALHAQSLLDHLSTLRERLLAAATLFESYADRLAAHEAILVDVRARALGCGLEVRGDLVLPPTGVVGSVLWSQLAAEVVCEHESLAAWVASELDAAVPSYSDPDVTRWVADFLDANRVSLAASGLETTATRGGAALTARELVEQAARLERLSKVPGPVSTVYETVTALESDTPAEGVAGVVGGAATASIATAALAVALPAAPVIAVGAVAVGAAVLGTWAGKEVWQALPDDVQDAADEVVGEAWDGVKDDVGDAWDAAGDLVGDLGSSLVGWAR